MLSEVKKLYKNNVFVVLWFSFLALLFIFSFLYLGKKEAPKRDALIEKYETFEELNQIIDITENLIHDLESDTYINSTTIEDLKDELELYQYLYNNKIEYNDFRMFNELTGYSNIKCVNVDYMTQIMLIFISLILFIANAIIFNEDYFIGTAKYLFNDKKKKHKIFRNKIILSLIVGLFLILVSSIIIYILSFAYEQSFTYIIYKKEGYYSVSASKYLALTYLYFIIELLFINVLSIGFSLFIKNPFINVFVLGALLFGWITIRNNMDVLFFENLRDSIAYNKDSMQPIIILIIKIVIVLVLFGCGIFYFKRKRIYK